MPFSLLYATNEIVLRIDNFADESELIVYPNPAQNSVTLKQKSNTPTIANYQIFDLQGKLLTSSKCNFEGGEMTIDISR